MLTRWTYVAALTALVLSPVLLGTPAHAITSTDSLPQGVRALAIVYGSTLGGVDSSLNREGNLESLVRPLNRSITLEDLAKQDPRLKQLQNVLNSFGPSLGDTLLFANLYSDAQVNESHTVAALFWGLTNKISVGLIVPKIKRTTQIDFRADVSNGSAPLRTLLGNTPQLAPGLQQLQDTAIDTATFEKAIFTSKGYSAPRSFEVEGLGDIEAEFRALYFESKKLDLAMRFTLRLPTASHEADLRNLFDRPFGDQSYGLRLGSLHSLKLIPDVLTFQSALFGMIHVPSRVTIAAPLDPSQDIADLNDPNQIEEVSRTLGAQVDLDTGLELTLLQGILTVTGSYQYMGKMQDSMMGSRGLDYQRLVKNTEGTAHSVEAGIQFSSVPLFTAKKAPIPGKIALLYHQTLAGQNVAYANSGRVDAVLFF